MSCHVQRHHPTPCLLVAIKHVFWSFILCWVHMTDCIQLEAILLNTSTKQLRSVPQLGCNPYEMYLRRCAPILQNIPNTS